MPLTEFYTYRNKGKYHRMCKRCTNEDGNNRRKTKHGLIMHIYGNQGYCAKTRGHKPPNYSGKKLERWMMSQDVFHELFEKWEKYDYHREMVPTCDRINVNKTYTLGNLQIVTNKRNHKNGIIDVQRGKIGNAKKVKGYVIATGQIVRFGSINDAARWLNIKHPAILRVCIGKRNHVHGYKLVFDNE